MPNTAMRIAPPAMRKVPSIIHGEKTSPKMKRAKKAFQSRDTAPRGASMTTGRAAICTSDPNILEEMKIAKPNNQSLSFEHKSSIFHKQLTLTVSDVQHSVCARVEAGSGHGSSAV